MDPPRAAYIYDYWFLWLAYTTPWRLAASLPPGFSHRWTLLPPPLPLPPGSEEQRCRGSECWVSTRVWGARCPVVLLQRRRHTQIPDEKLLRNSESDLQTKRDSLDGLCPRRGQQQQQQGLGRATALKGRCWSVDSNAS